MEKYAVDIDKVLDDFEENEALEYKASQQRIDQSILESWDVPSNIIKPNPTTEFSLENTLRLYKNSNSSDIPKCSENANTLKDLASKSSSDASFKRDSKMWDYEIFYKPFEPKSTVSDEIKSSLQANSLKNHVSTNMTNIHLNSDLNLSSNEDEILCVSMQKKDSFVKNSEEIIPISGHLKTSDKSTLNSRCKTEKEIPISSNVCNEQNNYSILDTMIHKNDVTSHNVISLIKKPKDQGPEQNYSNTFHELLKNNDFNNSNVNSHFLQNTFNNKHTESESEHYENDILDKIPESILKLNSQSEVKAENSQMQLYSPSKVMHSTNNEMLVSCIEHSTEQGEIIENINEEANSACSNQVNEVSSMDLFKTCDVKNISLQEMNEYLENLSDIDQAQDEDSGVSSQEDVNVNSFSPSEISQEINRPSISSEETNNYNNLSCSNVDNNYCVLKTDTYSIEKSKTFDSGFNNSEIVLSRNTNVRCVAETNALDLSNNTNDRKINISDETMEMKSSHDESGVCNSLTNLDLNSNKTQENFDVIPVEENLINCSLTHSLVSNDNNETNTAISNSFTDSSHFSCDNQDSIVKSNIAFSSSNKEDQLNSSSHEQLDECIEASENDKNLSKISQVINSNEINTMTADTANDNIVNFDTNTGLLTQRLQRPTTLDLPFRHAAKIDPICENVVSIPQNLVSPIETDIPSSETPIDDQNSVSDSCISPQQIGIVKPFWIPDADAPNCMHCGMKFTVIKRRHHCRACGKVLCSRCCNQRAHLAYLNKEDRICQSCAAILSSGLHQDKTTVSLADSQSSSSCGSSPNFSSQANSNFNDKNNWQPHPNNPEDYCSKIPPLKQIQASGIRPPPTVMVPIGVLKRAGNKPRKEPKQVIFSDGIRPGGDLTDPTDPIDAVPAFRRLLRKRVDKVSEDGGQQINGAAIENKKLLFQKRKQKRIVVSDADGPLPPILLSQDANADEAMDIKKLLHKMQDESQGPVNFAVTKNVQVFAKITKLDCCFGKECWCFTSHGLCTVGQDEIMLILERQPDEAVIPRGSFKLFTKIFDDSSKGSTFDDLGHLIFPEGIFGSANHRGFLFVRPTFQCLSKLIVPNTPFLIAILIQKWEVPWAKVFPLRLMLRLGAECRYYPCSLVSIRNRKPVYFEIGQTIMSVLSDLRNYQFTIPVVPGLVVHMEDKKTCVNIPRNRYEKVLKILNNNNVEHVLALGSNFSTEADSHLVCMQKDEGDYQTQAINIENTARRVTGASFIVFSVFSGALKSSSGLSAKFSIVEDGLLVQIPQETMVNLHLALKDMRDFTIQCGPVNTEEHEAVVIIQWTRDDKKVNIGVRSPIDGKSLEGIDSLKIHTSTDYAGDHYLIRWTEIFFLESDENGNSKQNEAIDPCRKAETIAQSFCMALIPYLEYLAEAELTKIGLRINLDIDHDKVEYDVGAQGKSLPGMYLNALDCALIPVLSRLTRSTQNEPFAVELIFHILIK